MSRRSLRTSIPGYGSAVENNRDAPRKYKSLSRSSEALGSREFGNTFFSGLGVTRNEAGASQQWRGVPA